MQLRAELVPGADALADPDGTVAPWRALAVAAGHAFGTPEWFAAWRRHYASGGAGGTGGAAVDATVVVVRDAGGAVVGVLPLAVQGRELRIAGDNVADAGELLAAPEHQVAVARAAGTALAAAHPKAHLVLGRVDRGAPWVGALTAAWGGRMRRSVLRTDVLPHLPITSTWDEFLAGRSRNFRNQVGRKERNLVRDHGASFRRADDPARIDADMKLFFALHEARWTDDEATSSLLSPTVQRFHADFAAAALEQGWLRLWFLEADGQEVATIYGWTVGPRACYFNAGWDPKWSETSVGLVLLAHAVRSAFAEGAADYDFLLGDEQYKYRFATEEREVESLVVARPLSSAQLGLHVERGIHRAGQLVTAERRARIKETLGPVTRRLPGARRR